MARLSNYLLLVLAINICHGFARHGRTTFESFFWTLNVKSHTFVDTLNTDGSKALVETQLKPLICKDAAGKDVADCTVTVISFTAGSTNINGQYSVPAGTDQAPLKKNVENLRNTIIEQLGNNPVTAVSLTASNFFKCTAETVCGIDEGDCDTDNECGNDPDGGNKLFCGINNCPEGSDPLADCCYNPAKTGTCDKTNRNIWRCCSDQNKCGESQGDCDGDVDCQDGHKCVRNSCANDFPIFPTGQADCCMKDQTISLMRIGSGNLLSEGVDHSDWRESFRNEGEPGQFHTGDVPKF